MRISLKSFIFFFLPVATVLLFQVEKNRLNLTHHKSSLVDDQSELASAYDDDSISFPAIDEDEDDSSESVVRLFPIISNPFNLVSINLFRADCSLPVSCKYSHKEISPSFLKVFRI